MNNQTNNENLSQGTNGTSLTNTALIVMKNTKECALKWKNAVPKGVQREHRRVMKNRIIAIAILFGDNFCDSESLWWKVRQQACC